MSKPDTSPLRTESGAIVVDEVQKNLDHARGLYRRQYDRGFLLSQKREAEKAQSILDRANKALREAEEAYAAARGRTT